MPCSVLWTGDEARELLKTTENIHVFGYGEDMVAQGLDVNQLPSIRVQTQGHRWAIMMPLEAVTGCRKTLKKGERVTHRDVLEFMHSLQPATAAAYLSMFPEGIYRTLLLKRSLAYCHRVFAGLASSQCQMCLWLAHSVAARLCVDRNVEAAAEWVGDASEGVAASCGWAACYKRWQSLLRTTAQATSADPPPVDAQPVAQEQAMAQSEAATSAAAESGGDGAAATESGDGAARTLPAESKTEQKDPPPANVAKPAGSLSIKLA